MLTSRSRQKSIDYSDIQTDDLACVSADWKECLGAFSSKMPVEVLRFYFGVSPPDFRVYYYLVKQVEADPDVLLARIFDLQTTLTQFRDTYQFAPSPEMLTQLALSSIDIRAPPPKRKRYGWERESESVDVSTRTALATKTCGRIHADRCWRLARKSLAPPRAD